MTKMNFQGTLNTLAEAHGFVLLYSITDRESFEYMSRIVEQVQATRKEMVSF